MVKIIWYRFADMASGGFDKTKYDTIYVKANNETEAVSKFTEKFGLDPYNVTCECCGEDYDIIGLTKKEFKKFLTRELSDEYWGIFIIDDSEIPKR